MRSLLIITIGVFLLIGLSSFQSSVENSKKNWEHLGTRNINWNLEKDVIEVGHNRVGFTSLKIKVTGGAVNMNRMMVTYGNGKTENIPLKFNFTKGAESRIIDLKGDKRQIKKISFWYDTKNRSKQKAKVHVFGKKGATHLR